MNRSRLLLSLALLLGWTLEQETEDRVQVRYGSDTPDSPRVDWLTSQVNADDAGEEATNLLLAALVGKLRDPNASQPNDPLSTDTKAICAELVKLTAAYREQTRAVVDETRHVLNEIAAQEAPPACDPIPLPVGLRPLPPVPPSDLLQVNQAVLALIQRQTEAEERIYNRFCDLVERCGDKLAATVLQVQSTQLAHEQWMKQADQAQAKAADTKNKLDAVIPLLERFLTIAEAVQAKGGDSAPQGATPNTAT